MSDACWCGFRAGNVNDSANGANVLPDSFQKTGLKIKINVNGSPSARWVKNPLDRSPPSLIVRCELGESFNKPVVESNVKFFNVSE